jgi:hypothetical protein
MVEVVYDELKGVAVV